MDISNLDANSVVQELVNEGRLPNPTIFDNAVIRKSADVPVVIPNTGGVQFDGNGWSLGNASVVGGRMSKGIEKIRAALINAGNTEAASHLPTFFVGAFWLPPDPYKGWGAYDPARFALPTPDQQTAETLSAAQVEQIENNLQQWMNTEFGFSGLGVDTSFFTAWRGENDGRAFAKFDDGNGGAFSPAPSGGVSLSNGWLHHDVWCHPKHYTRKYQLDVNGNPMPNFKLVEDTGVMTDHALFDRWWAVQTDENPVRYALSWLSAMGVQLQGDVAFWRS